MDGRHALLSLLSLARRSPRCFVGIPVAARDRPNAAPDVVVGFVGQVCERHAQRPVGSIESAAVQQHDSVVLGQSEGEVERVDVLLQVLDRLLADVLARPELEVDQTVIGIDSSDSG